MTTVVISQSNYLPWRGYFDLIKNADVFVFYDTAQYTKNDWRNRNIIKTSRGLKWLTVPVSQTCSKQSIDSIRVAGSHWQKKHFQTIKQSYAKAKYFDQYADFVAGIYKKNWTHLSELNQELLISISKILKLNTKFVKSKNMTLEGDRNQRLIQVCQNFSASVYLSGPSAKSYLDVSSFHHHGIDVNWMNYSGYRPYNQLHGEYEQNVSILDLLFNLGPNAVDYIDGEFNDSI